LPTETFISYQEELIPTPEPKDMRLKEEQLMYHPREEQNITSKPKTRSSKLQSKRIQEEKERRMVKEQEAIRNREITKLRQAFQQRQQEEEMIYARQPPITYVCPMPYQIARYAPNIQNEFVPSVLTNYVRHLFPQQPSPNTALPPTADADTIKRFFAKCEEVTTFPLSSTALHREKLQLYGLEVEEDILRDLLSLPEEELTLEELSSAQDPQNKHLSFLEELGKTPYCATFKFLYTTPPHTLKGLV
jgi:hypothetical protein